MRHPGGREKPEILGCSCQYPTDFVQQQVNKDRLSHLSRQMRLKYSLSKCHRTHTENAIYYVYHHIVHEIHTFTLSITATCHSSLFQASVVDTGLVGTGRVVGPLAAGRVDTDGPAVAVAAEDLLLSRGAAVVPAKVGKGVGGRTRGCE